MSPGGTKKAVKGKKPAEGKGSRSVEGVVYKVCNSLRKQMIILTMSQVSDVRIVIAVNSSESGNEDLDLPDRCRLVKLANSVTYDRCGLFL